jgi:glycine betaine/proline transport system substrate-binding protein
VVIAAATWLTEEAPTIVDYLGNVELTSGEMSQMLSWADENGADAEETARHFLASQQDVWTDWVPAEVAERVNAAVAM